MKRPGGITILSLLLGWLGIVGIMNAWFIFSGQSPDLEPAYGIGAVFYAASSLAACVGLWRMAPWAVRALHAWMLVCVVIFAGFALFEDDFIRGSIPGLIGFVLFIGLFFLGVHRYVVTRFNSPEET